MKNESPVLLGNLYPRNGQAGNIYSIYSIAPCLPGFGAGGGGKELKVIWRINNDRNNKDM